MKKLITAFIGIIICVACLFGIAGCGGKDETKNADGTPKNMLETVFDTEQFLYAWREDITHLTAGPTRETSIKVKEAMGESVPYNCYASIELFWKTQSYKVTKIEFDIASQTLITVKCGYYNTRELIGGVQTITIAGNQTKHITIDGSFTYYQYMCHIILEDIETTNKDVLNWNIKISNLFVTAEKI